MHSNRIMFVKYAQAILHDFANRLMNAAQCSSSRILVKRLEYDAKIDEINRRLESQPKHRPSLVCACSESHLRPFVLTVLASRVFFGL